MYVYILRYRFNTLNLLPLIQNHDSCLSKESLELIRLCYCRFYRLVVINRVHLIHIILNLFFQGKSRFYCPTSYSFSGYFDFLIDGIQYNKNINMAKQKNKRSRKGKGQRKIPFEGGFCFT